MTSALVPYGKTPRQIGALIMHARRLNRYGSARCSAEALDRMRRTARRRVRTRGNQHTFQQKCKHGHSLADAYTYTRNGRRQRQCRVCVTLRDLQRKAARRAARVVPQLQAAMRDAHPDRGGSPTKFIRARQAYLKAKAA